MEALPPKKQKIEYSDQQYHGLFGEKKWKAPKCTLKSNKLARGKKYEKINPFTKSEFQDHEETLKAKIKLLAQMVKNSQCCVLYAGAGISVNAGVSDYASAGKKKSLKGAMKKKPTLAHHAITAMHLHPNKYIKHFCQQNHDGLAQKSGYPQSAINEIHGTWHDKTYKVIKMGGDLREQNFEILQQWAGMSDLTIAVGTSLSGMSADMTAEQPIEKLQVYGKGQGLVIINKQMTRLHISSSLNIFSDLDMAFAMLLKELDIKLPRNPKVFMNKKNWRK